MGYFPSITVESALSVGSALMTSYFWLVRARRESPCLTVFQMQDFRALPRRGDPERKTKRLCFSQVSPGGVLVANNSVLHNSIIRFDCELKLDKQWIKGDFGWLNDEKPPWNLPPQTTIALSIACFFEVAEDYAVPEDAEFRVAFQTISGKKFPHTFHLKNRAA
ncbi:MAG: hypothetical protein AB7K24_21565 [Gemmataceae bacterium]